MLDCLSDLGQEQTLILVLMINGVSSLYNNIELTNQVVTKALAESKKSSL